MKIVFNCVFNELLVDHCRDLHEELLKRGHESVISGPFNQAPIPQFPDYDICIQPDESCTKLGAKIGVFICHGFDVKGIFIGRNFIDKLQKNSDYLFLYSDAYKPLVESSNLITYLTGMAKLDKCFKNRKNKIINFKNPKIFYAPTCWNKTNFDNVINIEKLKEEFNIVIKHHPATNDIDKINTTELLSQVDIVITDHSSIGIESVVLGIPTIMSAINDYNLPENYPTMKVKKVATILVDSFQSTYNAIKKYIKKPTYLQKERLKYGQYICLNQENSIKFMVDTLEKIYYNCSCSI